MKIASNSSDASNKNLVLICLQNQWQHCNAKPYGVGPAHPALLNARVPWAPVFSAMGTEVTGACWSPGRIYFLSCFQLTHPCLSVLPHLSFSLALKEACVAHRRERITICTGTRSLRWLCWNLGI